MLQSRPIKHIKLNSDLFRCETHWEKGLLPETIMVEFNFRIEANHENLKSNFSNINEMRNYVTEIFGIDTVSKIANSLPLEKFKFDFATYNYERDLESITRLFYNKHIKNFMFGFYVILESKNEFQACSFDDVNMCTVTLANELSEKYFKNSNLSGYFSLKK